MRLYYSIRIFLQLPYQKNNLIQILQKGTDIGIIYDYNKPNKVNCILQFSSAENVAQALFFSDKIVPLGIRARFQDTCFEIYLYKKSENIISLSLTDICFYKWIREDITEEDEYISVDFIRYIRLLLKWCNDFVILGIETDRY